MNLDIRLPIGLMFTTFGLILSIFGVISPAQDYKASLGINVNIWCGVSMLAVGLVFIALAWCSWRKSARK